MNRFCYWIVEEEFIKDEGYRICIVFENETGYHVTGDWPFHGKVGQRRPYFARGTKEEAMKRVDQLNDGLGLTHKDAVMIVAHSMVKP